MVFQKPNPFPKSIYDNVAWAPRNLGLKHGPRRAGREGAARRGALGRGQGPAQGQRPRPLRRPAAAALHRARDRDRTRRPAPRRAGLGARPDRHRVDRGPDAQPQRPLHDRDRHPQHAAGGPGRRPDRVLQPRHERRASRSGRWSSSPTPRRSSPTPRTRARATTSAAASAEAPRRAPSWARLAARAAQDRVARRPAASSGWPHCQQKVAPLLCGAPQGEHEPAVPVSSIRTMPFDLAQFGVGVLQGDRALDQDLDLDAVADRHLVGEAAEVPLQLRHPRDQLVAAALEVDDQARAPSAGARGPPAALPGVPAAGRCAGWGRCRAAVRRGSAFGIELIRRRSSPVNSPSCAAGGALFALVAGLARSPAASSPRRRLQDFFGAACRFPLPSSFCFDDASSSSPCAVAAADRGRCRSTRSRLLLRRRRRLDHDRRWLAAGDVLVARAADQHPDAERQQQGADAGDQGGIGGDAARFLLLVEALAVSGGRFIASMKTTASMNGRRGSPRRWPHSRQ